MKIGEEYSLDEFILDCDMRRVHNFKLCNCYDEFDKSDYWKKCQLEQKLTTIGKVWDFKSDDSGITGYWTFYCAIIDASRLTEVIDPNTFKVRPTKGWFNQISYSVYKRIRDKSTFKTQCRFDLFEIDETSFKQFKDNTFMIPKGCCNRDQMIAEYKTLYEANGKPKKD